MNKKYFYLIAFFIIVFLVSFYFEKKLNDYLKQKKFNYQNIFILPTKNFEKNQLSPTNIFQDKNFYQVVKIVDGDTIDVDIDGKTQRIRVIGINTPEVVDPRKQVECFGKEASEKAKQLLEGKKARLEKDPTQPDTDKYGRLLRYIFLEDETDFGLTMIKEGYAYEYTYNIPYKHQQQYKQAQIEAKENKRGLWADGVCVSPPTFNLITPTTIIFDQQVNKETSSQCQYSCFGPDRDCSDFKTQKEA